MQDPPTDGGPAPLTVQLHENYFLKSTPEAIAVASTRIIVEAAIRYAATLDNKELEPILHCLADKLDFLTHHSLPLLIELASQADGSSNIPTSSTQAEHGEQPDIDAWINKIEDMFKGANQDEQE